MSLQKVKPVEPNSQIKHISIRCPTGLARKTIINKNSRPAFTLKSNRSIGQPIINPIYVKGNQTPIIQTQTISKNLKSRSVCSMREAKQSKDWLNKARDNIIKELSSFVNSSNCIKVEVPAGPVSYRFYLGKGNNSGLIKQCLNSRPWLVQVDENQLFSANFVWTQFKNSDYFKLMPAAYQRIKKVNHNLQGKSISCNTLYEDITNSMKTVDISGLRYDLITQSRYFISFEENFRINPESSRIHNKIEFNQNLSDKKFLYKNMKDYYDRLGENIFEYLPLTFHIDENYKDMQLFINAYSQSIKSLWIVKPGENTNRGTGIFVSNDLEKIIAEIEENKNSVIKHSFIIQKYVERPFLINRRKFDIRLYSLVTSINGVLQGYFYQEGYLRTACKFYNPNDLDNKFIHLTNDAIQNKCEEYGKFESGNKLSYQDFQRYLDCKKIPVNFREQVLPKMKKIVKDTIKATADKLNKERRLLSFEVKTI